jgi:acetyl-CoA C-acetyltransferase
MTACIIGWAHTPFGKHSDETVESLVTRVAREAVEHAGLEASDIDEIYLGHFNAGFSAQDFTASLVLQADDDFRFKPATRVENACATGSAAVHQGIKAIRAGAAKRVLVVGVEQMTTTPGRRSAPICSSASYLPEEGDTPAGFAGVFGKIADGYFQKYGDQSDGLAAIAAKNHKNGVDNPWAQMRKDLGFDFCRAESDKNPLRCGSAQAHRLFAGLRRRRGHRADRRHHRHAGAARGAVPRRRACAGFPAHVQARHPEAFEGCASAWKRAFGNSKTSLDDLSFVETHDCFTIAELIEYEAMGLTKPGQGGAAP